MRDRWFVLDMRFDSNDWYGIRDGKLMFVCDHRMTQEEAIESAKLRGIKKVNCGRYWYDQGYTQAVY